MSLAINITRAQHISFLVALEEDLDENETLSDIHDIAKQYFSADLRENSLFGIHEMISISIEDLKKITKKYPFFTEYQKEIAGAIKGLKILTANAKQEKEQEVLLIDMIQALRIKDRRERHPLLLLK